LSKQMAAPMVSVIIPCRNEARYIRSVVDSVLSSDPPKGELEIIVVDGMSDDGTREVLAEYERKHPERLRVLDNPKKVVPSSLNMAIRAARGKIIVRLDRTPTTKRTTSHSASNGWKGRGPTTSAAPA